MVINKDKKILVLGSGSIGSRHLRILNNLGVKELGICDINNDNIQRALAEINNVNIKVFRLYEEALKEKFDAVFICTPPQLHVRQALLALKNGCNIFIEKPLSIDLEQINELKNISEKSDLAVMVGLCFRYHKGLKKVKSLIDNGAIGRLLSVRASLGEDLSTARSGVDYRSLYVTSAEIGVTLDLCHEIDFVLWIVGDPVFKVSAFTGHFSDLEMEGDDLAEILIMFKNRLVANIHLNFFQKVRRRISEYIGTEGNIILDMSSWNECKIKLFNIKNNEWTEETIFTNRDNMFKDMDNDFLKYIDTAEKPSLGIEEGTKSLLISINARKSSRNGKVIEFV